MLDDKTMKKKSIDVVIPLYKGKKYIEKQIQQIDKAAQHVDADVMLCFSNDCPDEVISGVDCTDNIKIKYLNTDKNNGIQVARIKGLENTRGEFVHFLDQDDLIEPNFYLSQLDAIAKNDVIYCRCYNGDRLVYNNDRIFEEAFAKKNILTISPLVSPGQALIRRSSIPNFWKTNILKNHGADDYLLWLVLYAEKAKIGLNDEVLFTHVKNGENYSCDVFNNIKSDKEVVNLIMENGILQDEEMEILKEYPEKHLLRRYTPQRKDQIVLQYLSQLLKCYEYGKTLEQYFLSQNVRRIAIFGAATMGERLKGLLKGTKVEVVCFIDRNADYIEEDIPIHTLQQTVFDFDGILLSQIDREESLENEIRKYSQIRIYRIRNIVGEMLDELGQR